jgi:hypothetical protein
MILRWKAAMNTSLQIALGVVVGLLGLLQVPHDPLIGSSALLIGGFLILQGVDRWC